MEQGDWSPEAEQALLGALLVDNATWDEVADVWRPEVFASEGHRMVAETLAELARRKQPFDSVMLLALLQARQLVPDPVPLDMPFSLAKGVGVAGNARYYAETLHGLWVARETRRLAREILDAKGEAGPALAARFATRLTALETSKARPARLLGSIILERLDRVERQGRGEDTADRVLTGFQRLDGLIGGFGLGHLTVLGARPGVGKSAFVSALADNVASNVGAVHVFQLEDYGDSLAERAVIRRAKINSTLMYDGTRWTPEHWERVAAHVTPALDLPIYVDDEHGLTPLDVAGRMRAAHRQHGVKLFIVDNLAELLIEGRGDRHDRDLGRAAKLLRDTAHALGSAVLLVVHLNREVEKRPDPTPRLSDLKNSGELEDAAHIVAFVYRPEDAPGQFVFDVAKNRSGPRGRVVLSWMEDYMAVGNPRSG